MVHTKQPWRNLPEKFLDRLGKIISPEILPQVYAAFTQARPTTFRTNTLKITPEKLTVGLTSLGFAVEPVKWLPSAFILRNRTLSDLTETEFYKNGSLYVQSLSSMIPALILSPQPGEKVLDLCAAPGSKTSQMAAMMGNAGEIIANDNSQIRIYKLLANLRLQGVANTQTVRSHGQVLWYNYPEYFDKSLVDVPCSMEGRFCTTDAKSYRHWTTGKVKELAERQRFLLRSGISATKVGGTIVYSTCTLSPEENEGVVDWILKKEPGIIEVTDISLSHLDFSPAQKFWGEKQYAHTVAKTIRILPSHTMEGFFVAKLRKINSNVRTRQMGYNTGRDRSAKLDRSW